MKRALALILLLVSVQLTACATQAVVTVLGPWTGAEERAFRAVLDEFTRRTGIDYDYHGTRSLSSALAGDVQNGAPPDVAVLPSPNELVNYQRQGSLYDVPELEGALRRSYGPQWLRLAGAGTGRPYGVVVKAALKSVIWYNRDRLEHPPATWGGLVALTRRHARGQDPPWCLGMGAMSASGFPGTDWIEDILLRRSGPDVYQQWAAGGLSWTDRPVRRAFEAWGELVLGPNAIHGGRGAALLTSFDAANDSMFSSAGGCFLEHRSSSVVGEYRAAHARYGFFPTPGPRAGRPRAWEVSADLAALFRDSPQGRRLLRFLASDDAQRIWPAADPGAAFTVNKSVAGKVGGATARRASRVLTTAPTLCFDASDLMPSAMASAFNRGVLGYLGDPGTLDTVLHQLERVRLGIPPQDWSTVACGNE